MLYDGVDVLAVIFVDAVLYIVPADPSRANNRKSSAYPASFGCHSTSSHE